MNTFGSRLRQARLKKGLNQMDVANHLGCAATSLTNWEKDKVQPSMETLEQLCKLYEISPTSLLSRPYIFDDLAAIAKKPVAERSYEDTVALAFSSEVLECMAAKTAEEGLTDTQQYQLHFIQLMERRVRNLTGEKGPIWMVDMLLSDGDFYTMFSELSQLIVKKQSCDAETKQYYDWKVRRIVEDYFIKFSKELGEEKHEDLHM